MGFEAKVLADSITPSGSRLTTWLATYCRNIHDELLTHKMLSRNSSSSRAIPTEKLIQRVVDDPHIPLYIGANQKGMQAGAELSDSVRRVAVETWLHARDEAVAAARHMLLAGVHKQVVNRVIQPWMWISVVISATETDNFFALRDHEAAEPHFQLLARLMRAARDESVPRVLQPGEWHLPFIDFDDEIDRSLSPADLVKVAVGRCARISYLTHEGRRDPQEDIGLHDRLLVQRPLHASPAEHVAQAMYLPVLNGIFNGMTLPQLATWVRDQQAAFFEKTLTRHGRQDFIYARDVVRDQWSANFLGWRQYRKTLKFESAGLAPL